MEEMNVLINGLQHKHSTLSLRSRRSSGRCFPKPNTLGLKKGGIFEATGNSHEAAQLDSIAFNGDIDLVRLLLKESANIEATNRTTGSTPLDTEHIMDIQKWPDCYWRRAQY
ncbi:hypothetical protein EV426DRAFT_705696 [Tirmania nivea]|nr:hypothetical protein EV426DRAFT_705696 [Tirmania nivea]